MFSMKQAITTSVLFFGALSLFPLSAAAHGMHATTMKFYNTTKQDFSLSEYMAFFPIAWADGKVPNDIPPGSSSPVTATYQYPDGRWRDIKIVFSYQSADQPSPCEIEITYRDPGSIESVQTSGPHCTAGLSSNHNVEIFFGLSPSKRNVP